MEVWLLFVAEEPALGYELLLNLWSLVAQRFTAPLRPHVQNLQHRCHRGSGRRNAFHPAFVPGSGIPPFTKAPEAGRVGPGEPPHSTPGVWNSLPAV